MSAIAAYCFFEKKPAIEVEFCPFVLLENFITFVTSYKYDIKIWKIKEKSFYTS